MSALWAVWSRGLSRLRRSVSRAVLVVLCASIAMVIPGLNGQAEAAPSTTPCDTYPANAFKPAECATNPAAAVTPCNPQTPPWTYLGCASSSDPVKPAPLGPPMPPNPANPAPLAPPMPPPMPAPTDPAAPPASTAPSPAAAPVGGTAAGEKSKMSGDGGGILGPITGKDKNGIPLSHYDIYADDTGTFDFGTQIAELVCNLAFGLDRMMVGFNNWMIDMAYDYSLVNSISDAVSSFSAHIKTNIIDALGLQKLLFLIAGAYIAVLYFGNRKGRGHKELAATVLIGASIVFFSGPADWLFGQDGLMAGTRDLSMEISSLALGSTSGGNSSDPSVITNPLKEAYTESLVRMPHQLLNYGEVLDGPGISHCVNEYNAIVAGGGWYGGNWDIPNMLMAGCDQKLADWNSGNMLDRIFGSIFALIATIIITIVSIMASLAQQIAPIALALACVFLYLAVHVGLIPGVFRKPLFEILKIVMVVLALILLLTVFLVLLNLAIQAALTAGGNGMSLTVRFALMDIVAILALLFRKRIGTFAQSLGHSVTAKLANGISATPKQWSPKTAEMFGATPEKAMQRVHQSSRRANANARSLGQKGKALILGPKGASPSSTAQSAANQPGSGAASATSMGPMPTPDAGSGARTGSLGRRLATGKIGRYAVPLSNVPTTALKYTVGAPVYMPRATAAARARGQVAKKNFIQWRGSTATTGKDFAREYGRGLVAAAAPARAVARAVGSATHIPGPFEPHRFEPPHVPATKSTKPRQPRAEKPKSLQDDWNGQ